MLTGDAISIAKETCKMLALGTKVYITSHGSQVTTLLEHLDDLVLVLGEDLSETISLLESPRRLARCLPSVPRFTTLSV
jgi:H+-transporting ATPase